MSLILCELLANDQTPGADTGTRETRTRMTGARELGLGRFPPLGHVPTSERKFAICNDDNTASLTLGARFNFHAERRERAG